MKPLILETRDNQILEFKRYRDSDVGIDLTEYQQDSEKELCVEAEQDEDVETD